jgi:hypothetical protein
MLEESIDPRPQQDAFARYLALRPDRERVAGVPETWLGAWRDQDSVWANLLNIEHWIERSRR